MLNSTDASAEASLSAGFAHIHLQKCRKILVAVSGGSDSMALLVGLHAWLAAQGSSCVLLAATVDHQLRAESADEARRVAGFCATLNIKHSTVTWHHDGVQSGVQQKARMARYDLLAQLAIEHDADLVLTGHTLDDQLETLAMRQKRGEGRGEAGIAPASCYNRAVWFARPLLGVRREMLRAYLRQRDIAWVDDPSNDNETFERVRVRKGGVETVHSAHVADAQKHRLAACHEAAALLGDKGLVPRLERTDATLDIGASHHDGWPLALAAILSMVGEKAYFPNVGALQQAVDFIAMQTTSARQNNRKLTVHGCLLTHRDGQISVKRELRHCAGGFFGLDRLVPSFDLALADVIYDRLGEASLPNLPFDHA